MFLSALHSTPAPVVGAAGILVIDLNDPGRREWLEHGITVAAELRGLDSVVDQALAWLRATPSTPAFGGPLQLIHGDLAPEHVLVDPTTGFLGGIIDWTDTMLGDAARDFVFLVTWRGWRFVEEVLRVYPRAVDREFRARLRYMAQLLSVIWLAFAHEQGADLAKHVKAVHNAFAPDDAS
jgi:aminoglycoside phosphotransferase (APT) family kinase protein